MIITLFSAACAVLYTERTGICNEISETIFQMLLTAYRVPFPEVKRLGRGVAQPPM